MSSGCCGIRGLRQVRVGDSEVGLTGVDAALESLYIEGWSPEDQELGEVFVDRLREAENYIPPGQEPLYVAALVDLFRQFYEANTAGNPQQKSDKRV